MRRSLVDAPTVGDLRDDPEPPAADAVDASLAHLVFEAGALVDDLAADRPVVDLQAQHDGALAVDDGVAYELAERQHDVMEQVRLDQARQPTPDRLPRRPEPRRIALDAEGKVQDGGPFQRMFRASAAETMLAPG